MSEPTKSKPAKNSGDILRCSFCNKSQRDVRKLIAGPTVYICDECVKICLDILAEDGALTPAQLIANPIPSELLQAADKVTPGHDDAKRLLGAALVQHASRIAEDARQPGLSPIFVSGATGAGKSQLVTSMTAAAGLAVATIEVPLLFADSPFKAKLEFPEFEVKPGVIILNKMETVVAQGLKSEEHRRVQQALISIIDGAWLAMTSESSRAPHTGSKLLDTSRTLFIALAAFPDLPVDRAVDRDTLIQYGYLPELIGRFGTFITLQPLTDENMSELLTREQGLVAKCTARFAQYGVLVKIEPAAITEIVRLGVRRKAGVRGLKALVDRLGIALACERIVEGSELTVDAAYVARNLE